MVVEGCNNSKVAFLCVLFDNFSKKNKENQFVCVTSQEETHKKTYHKGMSFPNRKRGPRPYIRDALKIIALLWLLFVSKLIILVGQHFSLLTFDPKIFDFGLVI